MFVRLLPLFKAALMIPVVSGYETNWECRSL